MNVEFGYGRMKWVNRKTILKHLKIDLYISSNPIQKKSSVKIGKIKLSKKEKPQYQKLKKQKLFVKFDPKTDLGTGKMKRLC